MVIDEEFLRVLACPVDHAPVVREGDRIVCTTCGRRYPIRRIEGAEIPIMLADEAELPG